MRVRNRPPPDWRVTYVDQAILKIPEKHLRSHSKEQLKHVRASLDRFDFLKPILVDNNNYVVDGVAQLLAIREMGLPTVPIRRLGNLTIGEARAASIALNKTAEGARWIEKNLAPALDELLKQGFELEELGFSTSEYDALLGSLSSLLGSETHAQNLPANPTTLLNDLWGVGDHLIVCGDSLNPNILDHLIDKRSIGAVITDPPYNVPIQGFVTGSKRHPEFSMAAGEMSEEEFSAFIEQFLRLAFDRLLPGRLGYFFIDWRSLIKLLLAGQRVGFQQKNLCVWVKPNGGMGSFYRSRHELVAVLQKPGGKAVNNVQLGKHGRNRTNVWEYPGVSGFSNRRAESLAAHPTVKPTAMIEDAIKDCTHRGEYVLDPFGGSGTIMLAAQRCGRRALLCEISPAYVDVCLERFQKEFGIEAIQLGTGLTFSEIRDKRSRAEGSPAPSADAATRRKRTPVRAA